MSALLEDRTPWLITTLARVPEHGKAEIVNGVIVIMPPTGFEPGRASSRIYLSLLTYEATHGGGYAVPDNVGILVDLPQRQSFSPDASWHPGPPTGGKFLQGAPTFAAEVRSEDDYGVFAERKMAEKRADYFAAGTLVVWDVDVLRGQSIAVYHADAPEMPTLLHVGETATAEPAVPGWTFAVSNLFG